jgi:hypothetical protein
MWMILLFVLASAYPPQTNNCELSKFAIYPDYMLKYTICFFTVQYELISKVNMNDSLILYYPNNSTITITCPDAIITDDFGNQLKFPHIYMIGCAPLRFDLYMPAQYFGNGTKLWQSVNDDDPFFIPIVGL